MGDPDAFSAIVRDNQRWLRGYFRARLADWATADDLAQDVFITAFRQIQSFRGDSSVNSWLRGIAHNHLRNHLRKHREQALGGSEELQYVEGKSVHEISQITGKGYSAHTMQFHRLRELLAKCITNELEGGKHERRRADDRTVHREGPEPRRSCCARSPAQSRSRPQGPARGPGISAWHAWADVGPVGRLRVGVHGGMAIGSTNLRDGRWHHVAVVLYPAENPEFGQHVLLFVNGALEPVSKRLLGVIDTSTKDASHGVWLGRNINIDSEYRFFRGALDEVYIFEAALSQEEIRTLMQRNEPPK